MGMTLEELYGLTLRSFTNAHEGYLARLEYQNREAWERARWQAMHLLSPHMRKGKTLKASDLGIFNWEKSHFPKEMSYREKLEMLRERTKNWD